MKFHKIRGVEKKVCTAEQKIAYNYAAKDYAWILRAGLTVDEYIRHTTKSLLENEDIVRKYDIDAIIHCLRQGIVGYCGLKCHILTSYQEIGNMFPSLYTVK